MPLVQPNVAGASVVVAVEFLKVATTTKVFADAETVKGGAEQESCGVGAESRSVRFSIHEGDRRAGGRGRQKHGQSAKQQHNDAGKDVMKAMVESSLNSTGF
jgi:hypothetical protein